MLKPLLFKSYIATITNSVNSNQYKNFFVFDDSAGEVKDILENGNLSCAIFVSNILNMFTGIAKLIDAPHVTFKTTLIKMKESGWYEIKNIRPGAILCWESVDFGITGFHEHVGFALNMNEAVSNDYRAGCIARHHITFNNTRNINAIYWHDALNE